MLIATSAMFLSSFPRCLQRFTVLLKPNGQFRKWLEHAYEKSETLKTALAFVLLHRCSLMAYTRCISSTPSEITLPKCQESERSRCCHSGLVDCGLHTCLTSWLPLAQALLPWARGTHPSALTHGRLCNAHLQRH